MFVWNRRLPRLGGPRTQEHLTLTALSLTPDPAHIAWEAAKVGFDALTGELDGGMDAWTQTNTPAALPLVGVGEMVASDPAVLDVRQANEFAAGHVPGAQNVELGALLEHLGQVPQGPVVVICGHSERAMSAASLLERTGRTDVQVLSGGADDWSRAAGRELQVGA